MSSPLSQVALLTTISTALHVLVFNVSAGLDESFEQQSRHMHIALRNWKAVWNRRLSIDRAETRSISAFDVPINPQGENQFARDRCAAIGASNTEVNGDTSSEPQSGDWRRPGFWRHASEYWLLARIFVERMSSSQQVAQVSTRIGSDSESEMSLIRRYDEKDMTRLHSFLSSHMYIG
jgi:hypothetical protein